MTLTRMIILAALLLLGGCQRAASDSLPLRLRVLTYNIHHGEGTDGAFDMPRLARVIESVSPDLVALQEVDVRTNRASGVDQADALARLTGMVSIFGPAMDYDGGQYGEAILSRLPVQSAATSPLPHLPDHEPRAAVEITTHVRGRDVRFVGTHLDHTRDPADRRQQAQRLVEVFGEGDLPTILVGDLNAEPHSDVMAILFDAFSDTSAVNPQPTFPSDAPARRIDYVLVRPAERWRVVESRVLDEPVASDHAPLLVVLELD